MSWLDQHRSKLCTAEEAVRLIKSEDRVYYGGNAAIPMALVRALAERRDELQNVQLSHVLLIGEDPLSRPEMEGHFRHNSLFVGPADRAAVNAGRADYVPIFLHQIPRLLYDEIIPLDVTMVMVSPPDEHGFMSFGAETLANRAACMKARKVIVQVNEQMPRVLGDSFLHVNRVDAIVEAHEPLPELKNHGITDVERRIGRHVRGLIQDGATIQMGIGGIPDAVYETLDGVQDLGIHTEMISDGAMQAMERGIITGQRKTLHPPFVISQNENLIAVNSAIEVDLTGQICADSIGPRIYSGFGGQVDFIRGAARAKGGKPIIALPSTARKGAQSRIVPFLQQGAGVVTTRADVHYIITEHGVAHLFGKNLRERAEALIRIAHPDFRAELEVEAKERGLL
jgi:acyl-CoA hydrolase